MRIAASLSLVLALASCANRAKTSITLYEAGDYAGAAKAAADGLSKHPDDDALWQMRVRSALALGDADSVAKAYADYRQRRGNDDNELLQDLASATLSQGLSSPSVKLKVAAIDAIQAARIFDLADEVAERLGDDDDRVAAAAAGAILKDYPQAPQVAKQLLSSEEAEARRTIIEAIGKKYRERAQIDLMKHAGTDPDPGVRRAAIRWIGQIRIAAAVELLDRQLRHSDEGVRAAAAQALARIGTGDLAAFAQRALADRSLAVRLAGVDLLVAAKQTAELVKLAEDPDPMVAAEAAIYAKRSDLAAKAIERAAASDRWNVRAAAANIAVRSLGKASAGAFAKKLLADPDPRVRIAAARVVARAGDRATAVPVLVAAMTGDTELSAASDLADLGDQRGIERLDRLVRDPKATPDQRAAAASAHRGAHRVTPGLVAALADPNGVVRVDAAAVIAMIAR